MNIPEVERLIALDKEHRRCTELQCEVKINGLRHKGDCTDTKRLRPIVAALEAERERADRLAEQTEFHEMDGLRVDEWRRIGNMPTIIASGVGTLDERVEEAIERHYRLGLSDGKREAVATLTRKLKMVRNALYRGRDVVRTVAQKSVYAMDVYIAMGDALSQLDAPDAPATEPEHTQWCAGGCACSFQCPQCRDRGFILGPRGLAGAQKRFPCPNKLHTRVNPDDAEPVAIEPKGSK